MYSSACANLSSIEHCPNDSLDTVLYYTRQLLYCVVGVVNIGCIHVICTCTCKY